MVDPAKINAVSAKCYEENLEFRQFLKENADYDEVDAQFLRLHNKLFANYDCCQCANCCRAYAITLTHNDIETITQHLGQSKDDFIIENLEESIFDEGEYRLKTQPCMFLCADGKCRIQDIKPSSCKAFPFTDQPDRMLSMLGIIDFAEECPVVFEILERLKEMYGFRR